MKPAQAYGLIRDGGGGDDYDDNDNAKYDNDL
jgi:hypothetical protein